VRERNQTTHTTPAKNVRWREAESGARRSTLLRNAGQAAVAIQIQHVASSSATSVRAKHLEALAARCDLESAVVDIPDQLGGDEDAQV